MTSVPDQKIQIEERVRNAEKNVEDGRKIYEPLITSASERAAYDAFVPAWQAYLAACEKLLAISNSGNNAEAMKFFITEVSKVGLKAEATIDKIVATNLAGANTAEQSGTALYLTSRNYLMASVGFSILFALAAGYFLTRSVAGPVKAMTEAMTRLARGDLDVAIPATGQGDEIGHMADAVLVFKQQAIENLQQAEQMKAAEQEAAKSAPGDPRNGGQGGTGNHGRHRDYRGNSPAGRPGRPGHVAVASSVAVDTQSVAAASEQALANSQAVAAAAEQLSSSIRKSRPRSPDRADHPARGRQRRQRGQHDAFAKGCGRQDFRGHQADRRGRQPNQPSRAQRHHRGGACRRSRQRLCRRRLRGEESRQPDRPLDRRINRQIAEIQSVTEAAVSAMTDVGDRVREIDGATTAIAAAIEQQGAATTEIARNVSQTTIGGARSLGKDTKCQHRQPDRWEPRQRRSHLDRRGDRKYRRTARDLVRVVRGSTADADRRASPRHGFRCRARFSTAPESRVKERCWIFPRPVPYPLQSGTAAR